MWSNRNRFPRRPGTPDQAPGAGARIGGGSHYHRRCRRGARYFARGPPAERDANCRGQTGRRQRLLDWFRGGRLLRRLVRESGHIELHIVRPEPVEKGEQKRRWALASESSFWQYAAGLAVVGLCTGSTPCCSQKSARTRWRCLPLGRGAAGFWRRARRHLGDSHSQRAAVGLFLFAAAIHIRI
jgi:hypothetical protein